MQPEISIFGLDTCASTMRVRSHLDGRAIVYRYVNLDKDDHADRKVREWNYGKRITPTVVIAGNGRTRRFAEPANDDLDVAISEQAA